MNLKVLGLFALPEMVALAARGGSISRRTDVIIKGMQDIWQGVRDVFKHWQLVIRSDVIGFIIGIIPALGGTAAVWIALGQAKQTSKHPETFGTGNVEGVIAPESANNAVEAGALLTTLALGIPGSSIMALLIGGMLIMGLTPGPEMMTKHLGLSLTLIWAIAAAGVIGLVFYLPLCRYISRVAFVPGRIIVPLVIVVVLVGSFAVRSQFGDVIVTFVLGIIGVLMRRYHYNRPALFLSFILGSLFEKYLFIALKLSGPLFFVRPISLLLIICILAVILYDPIIKPLLQRWKGQGGAEAA